MIGPGCVLPVAIQDRSIQAVVNAVRLPHRQLSYA